MYLDPGFGGMLVQVIVAIVAMGGSLFFVFRKKITGFFKKNKQGVVSSAESPALTETDEDVIDVLAGGRQALDD